MSNTEPSEPQSWEDGLIADLRANGGRPSGGPLADHPLMLMFSTGTKSGERRRSILTYSRDGDRFVVAGTAGGSDKAPKWIANVTAQPQVTLEINSETFEADAEIAVDGDERERLWNQHVQQLPWFADYSAQVRGRVIPMVRLTRRGTPASMP